MSQHIILTVAVWHYNTEATRDLKLPPRMVLSPGEIQKKL